MTSPRIRISDVMAAIALASIDLAVMRYVLDPPGRMLLSVTLSALPMANVLAVLVYRMATRRRLRPLVVGFTIGGVVAMLAHVAIDRTYPQPINRLYDGCGAPFVSFCMAPVASRFSPEFNGEPTH